MTLDDQLDFTTSRLSGAVPLVTSTFDSMTSATTGIALRLTRGAGSTPVSLDASATADARRRHRERTAVPYEVMSERIRKKSSADGRLQQQSENRTHRARRRGAGNDALKRKAIGWMRLVLSMRTGGRRTLRASGMSQTRRSAIYAARCKAPRRTSQGLQRMLAAGQPALLHDVVLDDIHNVHRLRWMLKDAAPDSERRRRSRSSACRR